MSGYYQMHRGWMDNPVFAGESYSRRAAWVWLIEKAAWKPHRVGVGTKIISLERGQLCHSLRHIASAWKWDDSKVRRFISRLEKEDMIVCVADAGQTVITICNYDEYQIDGCDADAETTAAVTQRRRSNDAIKKEGNNIKPSISRAGQPENGFEAWYAAYPRRVDPGRARKAYASALKKAAPDTLLSGARAYAAECIGREPQFIKHPATWLNAEAWLNQAAATAPPSAAPFDPEAAKWEARVAMYRTTGAWEDFYGPKPDEPGCRAPAPILARLAA